MTVEEFLKLAAAGAIITTMGSFLGSWLKDYFFVRSFEGWKERMAQSRVHRRYRAPLALAALELLRRLHELLDEYPSPSLRKMILYAPPSSPLSNNRTDPHFLKYKLVSTCYRFCALFGWMELYRQEMTFFSASQRKKERRLGQCVNGIHCVMSDGQLNEKPDWELWDDRLIFREELRAIGDRMLVREVPAAPKTVMGFAAFEELLDRHRISHDVLWLFPILAFLLDAPGGDKDFRRVRLMLLGQHLVGLVDSLDDKLVEEEFRELANKWAKEATGSRLPPEVTHMGATNHN